MCGINVPITVTGRRDPSGAGLLGLTTFHTSWIIGEPLTAIIAKVTIIPLPDFWVWAPLCISGSLAAFAAAWSWRERLRPLMRDWTQPTHLELS
jgi:hypothetical protein